MTYLEFEILYSTLTKSYNPSQIAGLCDLDVSEVEKVYLNLEDDGYISNHYLTEKAYSSLEPFKVKNAIIMAAGLSSRCLPLSKVTPKGLFKVRGEVLIEREICQLKEKGINEIIIVTGYLAEQFEYLREKYGVVIVNNPEYRRYNNTTSIYAVKEYLSNSYICCSDNYFTENIFQSYVYDSYYTCKYTEGFLDEFCIVEHDGKYIKKIVRGGKNCPYTMGAVYFSKDFSDRFIELLSNSYNEPVKHMLIDTFHLENIDKLPSMYRIYPDNVIYEFDTLDEFSKFDKEFIDFYNHTMEKTLFERYEGLKRYNGVTTDMMTGRLHYNENLWGPSPKCIEVLYRTTPEDLYLYDSTADDDLIEALASKIGINADNIFLHNGSAEIIKSVFSVMIREGDSVLLPRIGWSYYSGVVDYRFGKKIYYNILENRSKCEHDIADIEEKIKTNNPQMVVITSPAMPTGNVMEGKELMKLVEKYPGSLFLIDEAYHGFCKYDIDISEIVNKYDNIVFSRSFSKYYALANMRIGYGICSRRCKETLWLDLPLHRLSHIAKRMAIAALGDDEYYSNVADEVIETREWFRKELMGIEGVQPYESDSNFIYINLTGYDVENIKKFMENNGYLIRIFDDNGVQHLRITIAPKEIMEDVNSKLKAALMHSKLVDKNA